MSWILWGILIGLSVILLILAIIYIVNHASNKKYKEWWSQSEFNVFKIIEKYYSYSLGSYKVLHFVLFQPFTDKIYDLKVDNEFYYGREEGDFVRYIYRPEIIEQDGSREYYSEFVNKKFKWFRSKVLFYISVMLTTLLPFVLATAIPLQLLYMPGPKCEKCGHYSTASVSNDQYTCLRDRECDYHGITLNSCKGVEGKHISYLCNHCSNQWHVVKQKDKQKRNSILINYADAFQVEDENRNKLEIYRVFVYEYGDTGRKYYTGNIKINDQLVKLASHPKVVIQDSKKCLRTWEYQTGKVTYYTIIKFSIDNGETWEEVI